MSNNKTTSLIQCPKCGSENIHSRTENDWICYGCGNIFCFEKLKIPAPIKEQQIFSSPEPKRINQRIFLSYARDANKPLARRIKEDLQKRGHDVWMDEDRITAGEDWRRRITKDLIESNQVLSVLSNHALRDKSVCLDELEISLGVLGGNVKTILAESLEKVNPPNSLSDRQRIDMHQWREMGNMGDNKWEEWYAKHFKEIVEAVESRESQEFVEEMAILQKMLSPNRTTTKLRMLQKDHFVGRQWVFDEIEKWRSTKDSSPLFWISGKPGMGKSAIAAQLMHRYGSNVISVQFCEYNEPNNSSPENMVRTLAYNIATRLHDYRSLLLSSPECTPEFLSKKNGSELFDYLVLDKLRNSINGGRDPLVVVIDALDEASKGGEASIVNILKDKIESLPQWLKLVVSSRPESDIKSVFSQYSPYILGEYKSNLREDIHEYLTIQFSQLNISPQTLERATQVIEERSEDTFLYVKMVCESIKKGDLGFDNLEDFPKGLGGYYNDYFYRLSTTHKRDGDGVKRVYKDETFNAQLIEPIALILAAKSPIPHTLLMSIMDWDKNELGGFVKKVGSLFSEQVSDDGPAMSPCHKTLVDWFESLAIDHPYFIDLKKGHTSIINNAANKINNNEALDNYTQRHLAAHCLQIEFWEGLLQLYANKWEWEKTWFSDTDLEILLQLHLQFKAEEQQWQVLDIYNTIKNIYSKESHWKQNLELCEQAYHLSISLLGGETKKLSLLALAAESIYNYAYILQYQNRHAGALSKYEEALDIYKALAKENSRTYLPDVAQTLNNLANLYSNTNDYDYALPKYEEALEIRRVLAQENPRTYLPYVAETLNNLANFHSDTNNYDDALPKYEEALEIRRDLAKENPRTYLPDVATTLNNLANLQKSTNDYSDALPKYEEALEIQRALAKENPRTYLPAVATTLNNFAILYSNTNGYDDALPKYEESLEIRRALAQENPRTYLPDVAHTLNNLAILYSKTNNYADALPKYEEALEIRRALAQENSRTYLPDVAMTLNNLAILYSNTNDYDDALPKYEEALEIRRALAKENSRTYLPDVASTLNNLALLHYNTNDYADALPKYEEALEIQRALAKENPRTYLPDVATTLNNLAISHMAQENSNTAYSMFTEAIDIIEPHYKKSPKVFENKINGFRHNLRILEQRMVIPTSSQKEVKIISTIEKEQNNKQTNINSPSWTTSTTTNVATPAVKKEKQPLTITQEVKQMIINEDYDGIIEKLIKQTSLTDSLQHILAVCYLKIRNYNEALTLLERVSLGRSLFSSKSKNSSFIGWSSNCRLEYKINLLSTYLLLNKTKSYQDAIETLNTNELSDENIRKITNAYNDWMFKVTLQSKSVNIFKRKVYKEELIKKSSVKLNFIPGIFESK